MQTTGAWVTVPTDVGHCAQWGRGMYSNGGNTSGFSSRLLLMSDMLMLLQALSVLDGVAVVLEWMECAG